MPIRTIEQPYNTRVVQLVIKICAHSFIGNSAAGKLVLKLDQKGAGTQAVGDVDISARFQADPAGIKIRGNG